MTPIIHRPSPRWSTLTHSSLGAIETKHHSLNVSLLTTGSWMSLLIPPLSPASPFWFTDKTEALVNPVIKFTVTSPALTPTKLHSGTSTLLIKTRLTKLIKPASSTEVCPMASPTSPLDIANKLRFNKETGCDAKLHRCILNCHHSNHHHANMPCRLFPICCYFVWLGIGFMFLFDDGGITNKMPSNLYLCQIWFFI